MPAAPPPQDLRDDDARALDDRIRSFIMSGPHGDAGFERLALEVFAHQYERDEPYRRYCDRFNAGPADVRSWRDVPPVPASAFASARLATFPPERTALAFESSGTTSGGRRASRLELDSSALYDASLLEHYRMRILPDASSMRLIALAPAFDEAPASSLSYMLSKIAGTLGAPGGGFFVRDGMLDFEALGAALREGGEPAVVFGTAFAFVHFFERAESEGVRFRLPVGSRVVETGGFKGKSRAIPRTDLYAGFAERLGVPRVLCASEYGMCELGSQWYDANIEDYFIGRPPRVDVKIGPHWARARVVDPVTAGPVAPGDEGLLHVFDLSNRGSVSAILTADVAREQDGGFVLLGRFAGAPPKGCSIAADALLLGSDDSG